MCRYISNLSSCVCVGGVSCDSLSSGTVFESISSEPMSILPSSIALSISCSSGVETVSPASIPCLCISSCAWTSGGMSICCCGGACASEANPE